MRRSVQWAPFWMPEEKREEYIRQRQLILEFDRKLKKVTSNGMEPVQALGKGLYIALVAMLLWIPFEWEYLPLYMSLFGLNILPVVIGLSKYLYVNEGGQQLSVYGKLKYMPVEMRIIRMVRMEYLIHFLKLPLITAMAAQLIGAMACNHRIAIVNVIFPIVAVGIYPLLIGWADIMTAKYNNRAI